MEFGQILKKLRLERGLTQQQLADIVGISKSTVSYYEHSKKVPSPAIIAQFADFFNVSLDFLMRQETLSTGKVLNADGLTPKDIKVVQAVIDILREKNTENNI